MQCSYPSCSKKLSPTPEANVSCPYCRTYLYCTPTCRQLHWDISHKVSCTGYQSSTTAAVMSTSALDSSTAGSESSKKKQKNLEDFEVINQPNKSNADLGKGSFGQVKLVRDKADPSKQYAMKVINKKQLMTHSGIDYLKREIKIQKKLDHPHIVKLYHYFEDKDNVYLVLEYAKNGNLFFYLRRKKTLTEKEAFIYFFQTCVGIDYLHKKGILHRDLKPENLLLDANGNIKVCDFGWSAEDVGKRNTFCGTVDYMAPEMVQNKAHDFKIDIWSLGVLLFELLHGYPPFRGKTANEKFQSILEKELKFKDGLSNEARDLISALLRSDPAGRPGFDFIFDHAWTRRNEKEFGMSVKSFIYDPSKKKEKDKDANKSGNTTPRSHSPIPQSISSTPKDVSLPKPLTPTNVGGGFPLSIDVNFSNPTTPQHSAYSPKMDYKPLSTSPLNAASTNIPSLNQPTTPQYSAYSPKADYKPLSTSPLNAASNNPSSINQIPVSPARSRNNLDDPFSQTGATTPTKGTNKAQELVQSIFEPPKERSKSPSRSGIFSPHRQYEGPQQVSTAFVDDLMQKRKTTNENPISNLPGTDFEASKRKTTHDISVTGQPERSNRFTPTPESYLPSSMNNISSPYNAKDTGISGISGVSGLSPLPRTNSDNSLAVGKPANANVIPSPSANAQSKSPSRDYIEFNKTVQASKVDPNLIKKTVDDDVPDIKESTKKDNFNFGHNIPKVQNINVQIPESSFKPLSSTPTASNADLHKSPRADYSQPYTPTTVEKSHTTQPYGGGYLDNSYQTTKVTTPTGSGEKAGYKDTGFKHPDIHNLVSSSSSNVVSSTYGQQPQPSKSPGRPYEVKEPEVQKPVQREVQREIKEQSMGKPTSSQQQQQQQQSQNNFSSPQTYYAENPKPKQENYAKEGDFFVPKNENIESMFSKADNYGWSNQNQNQMHSGGHNFESEPARITRVTSLLEKGHLSEVDQIMEKMMQNESQDNNGRRTQNERQGNQRRDKSPNADHGTEFRVTNIDKYLASYDLEGTEENQILDMLDTYYTTGKLENDDARYPKKKAPENTKEQRNKVEESFGEMSFQADAPQAKKTRNEMSFQEENSQRFDDRKQFRSEMSFADNPPDTEESPIEKMSRGQKQNQNQKAPHHIQEENEYDEEDDYYDRKARDKRAAEPATQKDSPRRKAAQGYNHQEDEEEEEQQYYRNQNRGKENDKKQEIRTEKRGGITFEEEEEELDRRIQQKQKDNKHMRTQSEQDDYKYRGQAPEQPRKQGQDRDRGGNANANYENKINEEAGSFIVRMVNKEKSEPTHNRANNKSYDNNAQNKRSNPQQYETAKLENQREDVMKRYRDRLNGLYGLNSGMPENQQQQQQQYGYDNGNNYQTNQKNRGNAYEQEEEEEEESPGFGRRKNDRKGKKESKYDDDGQYKQRRRKDDWPEEYEKEERHAEEQLNYYKNKFATTNDKSMTESYEDMKKRNQRLTYFMDDLDLEDSKAVSRPSWKNIKEIPKYQEQTNTETGLFGKITSLFTCLDRSDKNPPQKTRKGRKVY